MPRASRTTTPNCVSCCLHVGSVPAKVFEGTEGAKPVLVLTRKSNQSIMIGDDIEVSVLSIMGEKVRIGIQAPRDVPVFRKEVYLEIQQERAAEAAAKGGARAEVDAALAKLKNSA